MTESDKAVMQQALDALEVEQTAVIIERLVPKPHLTKAIAELKAAIAQPVQPVIYALNIDAETQKTLDNAFTNWEIKLCTDAIKQGNVTIRKPLK